MTAQCQPQTPPQCARPHRLLYNVRKFVESGAVYTGLVSCLQEQKDSRLMLKDVPREPCDLTARQRAMWKPHMEDLLWSVA